MTLPPSPAPDPSVPSLTLIFFNVPPAGHPAVSPVLKLRGGSHETDGLDVLGVGNGGGQLQQGDVIRCRPQIPGAQKDLLHVVTVVVGLQVPNGWCGRQLAKLDRPFIGISVAGRGGESRQGSSEGGWAT